MAGPVGRARVGVIAIALASALGLLAGCGRGATARPGAHPTPVAFKDIALNACAPLTPNQMVKAVTPAIKQAGFTTVDKTTFSHNRYAGDLSQCRYVVSGDSMDGRHTGNLIVYDERNAGGPLMSWCKEQRKSTDPHLGDESCADPTGLVHMRIGTHYLSAYTDLLSTTPGMPDITVMDGTAPIPVSKNPTVVAGDREIAIAALREYTRLLHE